MSKINLNQEMTTLDIGRAQNITGVLLHTAQGDNSDTDYFAGSKSGIVLEATLPNATQAQAQSILDRLTLRGYQYQPFDSERTVTDPAIEIGDYVTANGTDGIVLGYDITHSRLMAPTLKAPYDEEVNHEFRFETRQQREYKRETKYTRSRLTINADAITAEVARASKREGELSALLSITADAITSEVARANAAEGVLRSSIAQTASDITAKVSKESGTQSTFGWRLTDHDWSIFANGKTVLRATINGLDVEGKITATSGYIGTASAGFEIGNRYIRNGMTEYGDTEHNGVYIGTNGISLGGGKFKVDSGGNLYATSGTFTGNVWAKNIQYGGDAGTMGGGGITPQTIDYNPQNPTISPLSSYVGGGVGGGVGFNNMNGELVRAFIYGTTGNFSGGVSMTTLTASGISAGGGDNPTYHSISWGTYQYPTGVSVSGNGYVWVKTTDDVSVQVPTGVGGSLITNAGTYFNYLKG